MLLPFATTHYLTLVLPVLYGTSGNAVPPTISVLRCVESIFPRQLQSSQVFADGLRPIFPRSSSSPFSPRSPVQHLSGFSIHVHSGQMTLHLSLFLLMMQPSSSCLVLSLIILFGILSLHVTCNILLSHL